ncbi:nitrilase-related carbon-nitrogen hydrolase [Ammoniphilus resinae]|uniref:Amidohydrolase n=1 Tax=Ammoniphilus resinae TaxID=861532 RepID=A0ABS4GSV2_9BACL|nr:putative amidohydrolase [Ammoniphilus resinae]
MPRKYQAAAIQFNPTLGQKEENIQQCLDRCREAASHGAKLVVLPEMATTGYCFFNREEIKGEVEPIPGPTTERFEQMAKQFSCYIVLGMAEVDPLTDIYYNSAVLIGPQGIIGKYRKTHLYAADTKWSKEGDLGFPVFETELGKIGCLICMDYTFFEPARMLSLQEVEVLCNPTNWNIEKCPAPAWFTRAWENGVYVISANRSDRERGVQFSGGTSLIDPDGKLVHYIDDGVGIVYGEIDLDHRKNKLKDRQPKHYLALPLNLYLNNPLLVHRLYDENPLPQGKKSFLSIYQFEPKREDLEGNYGKIAEAANRAANQGAELLVLPELAFHGRITSLAEAEQAAVDLASDDARMGRLIRLAKETKLSIVLGIVEKESADFYNTIVLVSDKGIQGKYRKIHLNATDKRWAKAGRDGFVYVDLPLGRVGLLTGDDCLFPESTMSLAVWGTDVMAVPAAVMAPHPVSVKATRLPLSPEYAFVGDDPAHWHLWRMRAVECNTYIALANQTGESGMGFSGIFGPLDAPRDEVLCNQEEAVKWLNIDTTSSSGIYPDKPVRIKENVRMRSPRLYDLLVVER